MSSRSVSIRLPENGSLTLPWCGRALCAAEMRGIDPAIWAERNGAPAASIRILKAGPVGASTLAGDALGDVRSATTAFLESLATRSVLARIVTDGAIVAALPNRRVGVITEDASGWIVNEGAPKPMSKIELESDTIVPKKAASRTVVTREFLTDGGPALEQTYNRSLRDGVARAVDNYFLGQLLAGSDAVENASVGPDPTDVQEDLRTALLALQPSSSNLYWIGGRSTAIRAATLTDNPFPEMTPVGGRLRGLPVLVSETVDDDQLILLDAGALAGFLGDVEMRASRNASVEMNDNPTNNSATPVATQLVSMFQTDSVVLMTEVVFGVAQPRPAIASITGIQWGGGPST